MRPASEIIGQNEVTDMRPDLEDIGQNKEKQQETSSRK